MSYEKVIANYDRIYRKADPREILDLWSASTGDLNVYVHSPFCASICRFCYYKGVSFNPTDDSGTYERFYGDYLPRAIAPFLPMLEAREIGNYFFGGGTPSLMTPETMKAVFAGFPGLVGIPSKTFEIHPARWSEEQLDVLAAHGFNCCILGIQSFDEKVLERQVRIHAPFERIRALSQGVKARGMHLAADLIYRMDEIDADTIFARDLERVAELGCDVLSLQLNYDDLESELHTERFFELIEQSPLPVHYRWEGGGTIDVASKTKKKCLRLVRNEIPLELYRKSIFRFIRSLDEASKVVGHDEPHPSVVGFGSYRNPRKNTFSNVRSDDRTVEYIEVNVDWEPTYYVTFDSGGSGFFEGCAAELDRLRTLGPPPRGVKITFENAMFTDRENRIYREVEPAQLSVSWERSTPDIDAYVARLKELFPHWKWNSNA